MLEAASPSDPGTIAATLDAFVAGTHALHAVLLLDRGDATAPLVIDVAAGGAAEVTEGEETRPVESGEMGSTPLALPDVRSFAPMEVDVAAGKLSGPLGALDHIGRAVRDTAALFPGRSVLTVAFATTDPEAPLVLAARHGEPMVMSLGEAQYELPAGFPAG